MYPRLGGTTAQEGQSTNGFSWGGVEKQGPEHEQLSRASGSLGKKKDYIGSRERAGGGGGRIPRTPGPVVGVNKAVTKPYSEQLDDRHSCPLLFCALSPLKNLSLCLQLSPPSERDGPRHQSLDRVVLGAVSRER